MNSVKMLGKCVEKSVLPQLNLNIKQAKTLTIYIFSNKTSLHQCTQTVSYNSINGVISPETNYRWKVPYH